MTKTDGPFVFACSTAVFRPEVIELLSRHGHRLEALAGGAVRPATPEEERFLRVDREEWEPDTPLERAWVRLKGRRAFEAEKAPPSAGEGGLRDYRVGPGQVLVVAAGAFVLGTRDESRLGSANGRDV